MLACSRSPWRRPAVAEKGKLRERLTPEVMAVVFPGAERLGPEEGTPPAIAAYKDGKVAAYIFSTLDIVAAPGYATTPFDVIAGVDLGGRITGAKVIFHVEPYIYHDAVRQPLLDTYLARAGRDAAAGRCGDAAAGFRQGRHHQRPRHARRHPRFGAAGGARARSPARWSPCRRSMSTASA